MVHPWAAAVSDVALNTSLHARDFNERIGFVAERLESEAPEKMR